MVGAYGCDFASCVGFVVDETTSAGRWKSIDDLLAHILTRIKKFLLDYFKQTVSFAEMTVSVASATPPQAVDGHFQPGAFYAQVLIKHLFLQNQADRGQFAALVRNHPELKHFADPAVYKDSASVLLLGSIMRTERYGQSLMLKPIASFTDADGISHALAGTPADVTQWWDVTTAMRLEHAWTLVQPTSERLMQNSDDHAGEGQPLEQHTGIGPPCKRTKMHDVLIRLVERSGYAVAESSLAFHAQGVCWTGPCPLARSHGDCTLAAVTRCGVARLTCACVYTGPRTEVLLVASDEPSPRPEKRSLVRRSQDKCCDIPLI